MSDAGAPEDHLVEWPFRCLVALGSLCGVTDPPAQLEAIAVGVRHFGQTDGHAATGLADLANCAAATFQLGDGRIEVVDLEIQARVSGSSPRVSL